MLSKEQNFKNILVTLEPVRNMTKIGVLDREHGYNEFLLETKRLAKYICAAAVDNSRRMLVEDIDNILRVQICNGLLRMKLTWVNVHAGSNITGYQQYLTIPVEAAVLALQSTDGVQLLSHNDDPTEQARIELSPEVHKRIAGMDKKERRAFSKSISKNFHYGSNTVVHICPDWGDDYSVIVPDAYEGGFVRHVNTVTGKNGKTYEKIHYAVHT